MSLHSIERLQCSLTNKIAVTGSMQKKRLQKGIVHEKGNSVNILPALNVSILSKLNWTNSYTSARHTIRDYYFLKLNSLENIISTFDIYRFWSKVST